MSIRRFGVLTVVMALAGLMVWTVRGEASVMVPLPSFEGTTDFVGRITVDSMATTRNYTSAGGEYESLPNGGDFTYFQSALQLEYYFVPSWMVGIEGRLGSAFSVQSQVERRFTQFESVAVTSHYHWARGAWHLVPHLVARFPVFEVDPLTDDILIGEGAKEFEGGLMLAVHYASWTYFVSAAFRYRDGGRASVMPWVAGAEFQIFPVGLILEANGIQTVMNDDYVGTPQVRDQVTARVNAGSYALYSVNPDVIRLAGGLRVYLDDGFNLTFGYGQTLTGRNSAMGSSFLAQIELPFGEPLGRRGGSVDEEFEVEGLGY